MACKEMVLKIRDHNLLLVNFSLALLAVWVVSIVFKKLLKRTPHKQLNSVSVWVSQKTGIAQQENLMLIKKKILNNVGPSAITSTKTELGESLEYVFRVSSPPPTEGCSNQYAQSWQRPIAICQAVSRFFPVVGQPIFWCTPYMS